MGCLCFILYYCCELGLPAEKIRLSMATTAVMSDNSAKNVKGYKDLDFSTVTPESNTGTIGGVSYTFNGVKEVQRKCSYWLITILVDVCILIWEMI